MWRRRLRAKRLFGIEMIQKDYSMLKHKIAAVTAMFVAMLGMKAQASLPALPDTAIGDKTFLVIQLDGAKMDQASVRATAMAVLGEQAAMAGEGLDKYQKKHEALTAAGVVSGTMVFDVTDEGVKNPKPVVYIQVKAGSDLAVVKKSLLEDMTPEDQAKTQFSDGGNVLVMYEKDTVLPKQGSPAQAKAFAEAINSAGEKAVAVAFIPNEAIRAQVTKNLAHAQPEIANMVPLLVNSKSMTLSAKLGEAPTLDLAVEAADANAAKSLSDQVNGFVDQLREMAEQFKQNPMPQMQAQAANITALAEALKPVQNGSRLTMSLQGKGVAPMLMPMLMMQRRVVGPAGRPSRPGQTGQPAPAGDAGQP